MNRGIGALLAAGALVAAACTGQGRSETSITTTTGPRPVTTSSTTSTVSTVPSTSTTSPTVPDPLADPEPPEPGGPLPEGRTGVAVVARGGAAIHEAPDGTEVTRAHEGLVFPVEDRSGSWLAVLTPCNGVAWVRGDEVAFAPTSPPAAVGAGFRLQDAVVVLDPGHGGPNRGATGPSGLQEPVVNLDIARRARDLLSRSNAVDWVSGAVRPGDEVPPVGAVWLTRVEGPPGADYEAGLLFRARLAGTAGAHAFVSIHNNADPDGAFDGPGSEVFYSVKNAESRRLAGLVMEEFLRSFRPFDAEWMGDTDAGAKYRLRTDGETDYYGVLRRAEVPAVITEGAFITNPSEEALLATPAFRQAYAEALYRALVRFLTTDDPGSRFTEPYERVIPAGSGAPLPTCSVPEQPSAGP